MHAAGPRRCLDPCGWPGEQSQCAVPLCADATANAANTIKGGQLLRVSYPLHSPAQEQRAWPEKTSPEQSAA